MTGQYLTARFRLRLGADEPMVAVDVGGQLGTWNPGPPPNAVPVGDPVYNGDGSQTHTVRDATADAPTRFIRLDLRFP